MPDTVLTLWGYLHPGAQVVDAAGQTWLVASRQTRLPEVALWLTDNATVGAWVVQHHDTEVALLDTTLDRATSLVESMLGGVARIEALPQTDKPSTIAMYKAHLLHQHHVGTVGSQDTLADLIELHALEHASPRPGSVLHVHVPRNQL